ncbi:MAG: cytochrome P450 [Chloroflexi bacterium]|nr:cytochrome P450 [Chloroflexota bacterium]
MPKNPPGPKSLLPGGQFFNLPAIQRDPPGYLLNLAREYGDIVYFEMGPARLYLVSDPELIKDVLVTNSKQFMKGQGLQRAKRVLGEGLLTSEGEFHLRQRRLAQPAFHRQRIGSYAAVMADCGARERARWQDGAEVDIAREMMRVTLAIVGKTLFDSDVEGSADDVRNALNEMNEAFDGLVAPFAGLIDKVPAANNQRFEEAKARLDALIYQMIADRRASGDRGDLLSMLLLAQDDEGGGDSMTDTQLRDEAMTIFLAGHETTSNALTWTWYLLSQNPEVEAKLHDELDRVLGGRLPTAADPGPLKSLLTSRKKDLPRLN